MIGYDGINTWRTRDALTSSAPRPYPSGVANNLNLHEAADQVTIGDSRLADEVAVFEILGGHIQYFADLENERLRREGFLKQKFPFIQWAM